MCTFIFIPDLTSGHMEQSRERNSIHQTRKTRASLQKTLREAIRELYSWSSKDTFTHGYGCPGYFTHSCANSTPEKSFDGVLPFIEEAYILSMSTKPRGHLHSWQSENYCQNMRKMHVKTFVKRA